MSSLTTADVIAALGELAELTVLAEGSPNAFRVRAYQEAAAGIEAAGLDVASLSELELTKIRGVGKGIARMVRELIDTGGIRKLDQLRREYPPEFVALSRVPGLGPKKLEVLRSQLGVNSVADLTELLNTDAIAQLSGFGKTTQEKLKQSLDRLGLTGKEKRTPLPSALRLAHRLLDRLRSIPEVLQAEYAGSLRRFRIDIGDIDLLVASPEPGSVMAAVVELPEVDEVLLTGDTKTSFLTRDGLQVDVRVVAEKQFGAALMYFTGSKNHNVALRKIAIGQGQLLSEYGLFETETKSLVASETEEEIYRALSLGYIYPPLREGAGEIEASQNGELDVLVTRSVIRGDLHVHSDRSGDGRASAREMVEAGQQAGLEYMAFTEHGEDLAINGSDRNQLLEHRKLLGEIAEEFPSLRLLWGSELNIGKDGGLDYDPDFREQFDWTVASVHSYFDLSETEQTNRLLKAVADPTVNCIGHLTGRKIGRRPGIRLSVDPVLEAMAELGVVLEVNGAIDRLDADVPVIRQAVRQGVQLSIATDSHHPSEFVRMEYGVSHAQRAWVNQTDVINTRPVSEIIRSTF